MTTTLFLCGAGNSEGVRLALTINRKQRRWERIVLLDDDSSKHGQSLLGVEVVGSFDELEQVDPKQSEVANLVARTAKGRAKARQRILGFGQPFAPLVSPDVDDFGATLPDDVVIYQHSTIGPEVSVGEGTTVFMGGVVGHESDLGACCIVASNAVINARVRMGEGVYLGPNATVIYEVKIGSWATIGAGSAVLQDVPENATVIGVPGEVLQTAAPAAGDAPALPPRGYVQSRTVSQLEREIARVWADVLRVPRVGVQQNFFDAGGTSLLALNARQRIQQVTQSELSHTDMFRYPTVRLLARHMSLRHGAESGSPSGLSRGQTRREALIRRRSAAAN